MNFAALILVPLLHMTDSGVEYREVELPEQAGHKWVICVREYAAIEVRCYAMNADKQLGYQDFSVK